MERRLAAILAADVVGYTRLMGLDETGTLSRLKNFFDSIAQPSIEKHNGRLVKLIGDGLLAEFASAWDAVSCALDIRTTLRTRQADLVERERLQLRMGINLGDVIAIGDDIYGDGVNIAARLESIAEPEGLCISGTVFETINGKIDVQFIDAGQRRLKNITRTIQVFALQTGKPLPSKTKPPRTKKSKKPSIAVIPFVDSAAQSTEDYLAEGLTEDIIAELSRFSDLFVIARNSVFAFAAAGLEPEQAATEFGVRYVLQGTIRRRGNKLRLSAQLLDCETGTQLWGERFDGQAEDLFDLQDDITCKVVGSIAPQLERAELTRSRTMSGAGLSAYELAYKAQAIAFEAVRIADASTLQSALRTVDEALVLDPSNVQALWTRCLCLIYQHMYQWGDDADTLLDRMEEASIRLFKSDGANAKAFMARAWVHLYLSRFDAALADHRRSFELNPNLAMNLFAMSWTEAVMGLTDEARAHANMALQLSPRDSDIWLGEGYAAIAMASLLEGNFNEAIRLGNLAYQRQPGLQTLLITANLQAGDVDTARHHFETLLEFAPYFIKAVVSGHSRICQSDAQNAMLVDALRQMTSYRPARARHHRQLRA